MVFLTLKTYYKRQTFQNKQFEVLHLAFQAQKVLRTFEKQVPGHRCTVHNLITSSLKGL